jgi:hypothetical protein
MAGTEQSNFSARSGSGGPNAQYFERMHNTLKEEQGDFSGWTWSPYYFNVICVIFFCSCLWACDTIYWIRALRK